jgi:hypothetical protein
MAMDDEGKKIEEADKLAHDALTHMFRRGMWNSAILALMCASMTATQYALGSYWGVGIGVLAVYICTKDALDFHKFHKLNKGIKNG